MSPLGHRPPSPSLSLSLSLSLSFSLSLSLVLSAAPARAGLIGISVQHGVAGARRVTVDPAVSDSELKSQLGAALSLPPGSFALRDPQAGVFVPVSGPLLRDGAEYEVAEILRAPQPVTHAPVAAAGEAAADVRIRVTPGTAGPNAGLQRDAAGLPKPRLPRVMLAVIATGRYKSLGMEALFTAREKFGGDCIPSFYLLSDEIADVDQALNPRIIPHREWPYSGLSKFADLLSTLGDDMDRADYFYFLDADVKFEEPVSLADIAGDLVGVEHPMYPRFSSAFCPKNRGLCDFPYDRNVNCHAYIPWSYGKTKPDYDYGNWYYLQSAFWGGKTRLVKPALLELSENIAVDTAAGIKAMAIQDERYLNWYFWKHHRDPKISLRILGHSFLYPGVIGEKGFGPWLHKGHRAIIRHVDKGGNHLPVDELQVGGLEADAPCFDAYPPEGGYIGLKRCSARGGGAQSFQWSAAKPRLYSIWKRLCLDGHNRGAGDNVMLQQCFQGSKAQEWEHDGLSRFVNRVTGLCLDRQLPSDAKFPRYIGVSECQDRPSQKWALNVVKSAT